MTNPLGILYNEPRKSQTFAQSGPICPARTALGVTGWEDSIAWVVPGSYQKEVLSCQMQ